MFFLKLFKVFFCGKKLYFKIVDQKKLMTVLSKSVT